jgi:hypothetical protein
VWTLWLEKNCPWSLQVVVPIMMIFHTSGWFYLPYDTLEDVCFLSKQWNNNTSPIPDISTMIEKKKLMSMMIQCGPPKKPICIGEPISIGLLLMCLGISLVEAF